MSESINVVIKDSNGLHAKKCLEVVNLAQKFTSILRLTHNGHEIDIKSILGLMSLCVPQGDNVTIKAYGKDQSEALKALAYAIA